MQNKKSGKIVSGLKFQFIDGNYFAAVNSS